ncbi:MAG: hypothetical protein NXY57DRAFT_1043656 [Lentinula lateritia]|nr:MAG: hypothetical protein NXY57DRAFT_1043656 [Lentinula lateritia]
MPTALLLSKLWDLDLSNVEPRTASPLPPTTLKDVHHPAQFPGTYPPGRIPSRELTPSRLIPTYDLFESYIDVLASTTPTTQYPKVPYFYLTSLRIRDLPGPPRNPLKAPFELQPAPSMLQRKLSYTKPLLKAYSDPGLTQTLQTVNNLLQSSLTTAEDEHLKALQLLQDRYHQYQVNSTDLDDTKEELLRVKKENEELQILLDHTVDTSRGANTAQKLILKDSSQAKTEEICQKQESQVLLQKDQSKKTPVVKDWTLGSENADQKFEELFSRESKLETNFREGDVEPQALCEHAVSLQYTTRVRNCENGLNERRQSPDLDDLQLELGEVNMQSGEWEIHYLEFHFCVYEVAGLEKLKKLSGEKGGETQYLPLVGEVSINKGEFQNIEGIKKELEILQVGEVDHEAQTSELQVVKIKLDNSLKRNLELESKLDGTILKLRNLEDENEETRHSFCLERCQINTLKEELKTKSVNTMLRDLQVKEEKFDAIKLQLTQQISGLETELQEKNIEVTALRKGEADVQHSLEKNECGINDLKDEFMCKTQDMKHKEELEVVKRGLVEQQSLNSKEFQEKDAELEGLRKKLADVYHTLHSRICMMNILKDILHAKCKGLDSAQQKIGDLKMKLQELQVVEENCKAWETELEARSKELHIRESELHLLLESIEKARFRSLFDSELQLTELSRPNRTIICAKIRSRQSPHQFEAFGSCSLPNQMETLRTSLTDFCSDRQERVLKATLKEVQMKAYQEMDDFHHAIEQAIALNGGDATPTHNKDLQSQILEPKIDAATGEAIQQPLGGLRKGLCHANMIGISQSLTKRRYALKPTKNASSGVIRRASSEGTSNKNEETNLGDRKKDEYVHSSSKIKGKQRTSEQSVFGKSFDICLASPIGFKQLAFFVCSKSDKQTRGALMKPHGHGQDSVQQVRLSNPTLKNSQNYGALNGMYKDLEPGLREDVAKKIDHGLNLRPRDDDSKDINRGSVEVLNITTES